MIKSPLCRTPNECLCTAFVYYSEAVCICLEIYQRRSCRDFFSTKYNASIRCKDLCIFASDIKAFQQQKLPLFFFFFLNQELFLIYLFLQYQVIPGRPPGACCAHYSGLCGLYNCQGYLAGYVRNLLRKKFMLIVHDWLYKGNRVIQKFYILLVFGEREFKPTAVFIYFKCYIKFRSDCISVYSHLKFFTNT